MLFLLLHFQPLSSNGKLSQTQCRACSHVHGAIYSRAYVHNKATVSDAIHVSISSESETDFNGLNI